MQPLCLQPLEGVSGSGMHLIGLLFNETAMLL